LRCATARNLNGNHHDDGRGLSSIFGVPSVACREPLD
jgi:hypothetical protein